MDATIDKLKSRFMAANMPMRFIYINVAIFVVVKVMALVMLLCGLDSNAVLSYVELPTNISCLATQPWTVVTYMFVHYDIMHILFNMLWLYWFGALFLEYFNARQFVGLYLLGGLGGALFYVLAYNVFPYFSGQNGMMIGASASILAIVAAMAVRAPEYKLNLLLVGAVSLKWVAIITLFIDFISIDTANAGGHIAHLGGAAVGALMGYVARNGRDITAPINSFIDWIVNVFRRGQNIKVGSHHKKKQWKNPFIKTTKQSPKTAPRDNRRMSSADEAELDAILAKIKQSGYKSLTADEKKRLFEVSRR